MTVKELWEVSPQAHVMIRNKDKGIIEYQGSGAMGEETVEKVLPTTYPMHKNVLEVRIKG